MQGEIDVGSAEARWRTDKEGEVQRVSCDRGSGETSQFRGAAQAKKRPSCSGGRRRGLRCLAVVVFEQAAEPLVANNFADCLASVFTGPHQPIGGSTEKVPRTVVLLFSAARSAGQYRLLTPSILRLRHSRAASSLPSAVQPQLTYNSGRRAMPSRSVTAWRRLEPHRHFHRTPRARLVGRGGENWAGLPPRK